MRWVRSATLLVIALAFALWPNHLFSAAQKDWETLENCQLIDNKDNDGDSFHIKDSTGTEYLVRLYLVDAPETKSGMAGRLDEQATYFGITAVQVVEVGRNAKKFVDTKLAQPFTVLTRRASGLGRSKIERFYGFVQTKDGDLGELLVRNGLARVHGKTAVPPGGSSSADELNRLHDLEDQAKKEKLGGWSQDIGAASGTPQPMRTVASPSQPAAAVASTPIAPSPRTSVAKLPPAAVAANSDKFDVNTATKEQLEKIPGIGDGLAKRIIAARPFQTADDLKKVKGIGSGKRYNEVRPYFK
jgi:DNA uptake protein ComE-like DNA-binding protein